MLAEAMQPSRAVEPARSMHLDRLRGLAVLAVTCGQIRALLQFGCVILAIVIATPARAADEGPVSFEISEPVERNWTNERIRFAVAPDVAARLPRDAALVDASGREVPREIVTTDRGTSVDLLVDLAVNETRKFHFDTGRRASAAGDLGVAEPGDEIALFNDQGGIRLRKACSPSEGPVVALKLPGGGWYPVRHTVQAGAIVTSCSTEVVRRGPVLAAAVTTWAFASGHTARFTFELQARDAAVQVDEAWSSSLHPAYNLVLDVGSKAIGVYFRKNQGNDFGRVALQELGDTDAAFELEPWVRWWIAERRNTWVAFNAVDSPSQFDDVLVIAAIRAADWIDASEAARKQWIEPIRIAFKAGQLLARFGGSGVRRRWLAAVLPRAEAIDRSLLGERRPAPPQRLRIKHSDFPLDQLKDWIVAWPAATTPRPALMTTANDIAWFRSGKPLQSNAAMSTLPVNEFNLGRLLQHFYATNDQATRRRITGAALPVMREALDEFLDQKGMFFLGFAPNHLRVIVFAVHLADFALADPEMNEADKRRLRKFAAALSYNLHRADYWSQEKGYGANPNMSSMVASYQGLLAALLHDHPESRRWLDIAVAELFDNELLGWSDENGGWLEAPHYAMDSQEAILGFLLCARNAGRPELLANPRLRKLTEWFAKTSTPPDPHAGNARMLAPIGNTMLLEPTGQFGTMAYLFRDIDPSFSGRMQWMHVASGSPILPGVGGFAPTIAPYQLLFKNPALPSTRPDYGSELFPKTGAILRSHFGTDRETQLHVIAGSNHAHYDIDSGSITFWGKGRVLANDWGYTGYGPAREHSIVDAKSVASWMQIEEFATSPDVDRFKGVSGAWRREIVLVKDESPLGPNYALLTDSLAGKIAGKWRLWLTGERIERRAWGASLVGRDDVDLDIVFLGGPPPPLDFETKTLKSVSSIRGPIESTQTAIVTPMPADSTLRVLLYPRLKSDPPPVVTGREGGRVIELETTSGLDTLFAGVEAFEYRAGGLAFRGTYGLARIRPAKFTLSLGAPGRIEAGGRALDADRPRSQSWHR